MRLVYKNTHGLLEVMKTRQRMCKAADVCKRCPLSSYNNKLTYNNGEPLSCYEAIAKYPEEMEKLIVKWAEEHPIKTNGDNFLEKYPDASICEAGNCNPIVRVALSRPIEDDNCVEFPAEWWDTEYQESEA